MDLEADFEQRLRDSIRESIALGYNPTRFTAMLDNYGGVGVAKRLVASRAAGGREIEGGILTIWRNEIAHREVRRLKANCQVG
jgi:hypothetical protein